MKDLETHLLLQKSHLTKNAKILRLGQSTQSLASITHLSISIGLLAPIAKNL